jgi:hypothetical protein
MISLPDNLNDWKEADFKQAFSNVNNSKKLNRENVVSIDDIIQLHKDLERDDKWMLM